MTTAREIAAAISSGLIPHRHIGAKSFLVIQQEIFSCKNEYTPDTDSAAEKAEWQQRFETLIDDAMQLGHSEQEKLFDEVDKLMNPNGVY